MIARDATVTPDHHVVIAVKTDYTHIHTNYAVDFWLWQRDRAKLDTFSINVQRYSQNQAHNQIFGPPMAEIFNTTAV